MATPKRYYWIKLRESFMTGDIVDYLMAKKDGANYVVLYQMLCLKTINTNGRLSTQLGEMLIPFDIEKIQRDCKWFSADTIRIALNLYKGLGLIYEDLDGTLVLTDHNNLVGSETDAAARMRNSRAARNALPTPDVTPGEQGVNNVTPDIRDIDTRDIEDRDKRLDSGNSDVVVGNPFGDDFNVGRPDPLSVEIYATSNLQYLSPYNMEELTSFRDSLPDELIRYAIDQACANGVRTYAYTKSILNSYVSNGFKSIGDVQAHEARRRKGQQNGGYDYSQDDDKGW